MCRALLVGMAFLTGCSGTAEPVPVSGAVRVRDGGPLTTGRVILDSQRLGITASGTVQPDGRFELGTNADADGVVPGEYRVVVRGANVAGYDGPVEMRIDPRYENFETSGLTVAVDGSGQPLELVLDPPPEK